MDKTKAAAEAEAAAVEQELKEVTQTEVGHGVNMVSTSCQLYRDIVSTS